MGKMPFEESASGDATGIVAEAIGEPGRRRFRLVADIEGQTYIVWLEKEQLRRLAEAIGHIIEQLPTVADTGALNLIEGIDFESRWQFRAGRMALGYDERRDLLTVTAHDIDDDDERQRSLTVALSRQQALELAEQAEAVVSAGRPLCALCGRPMGPGPHVCEKQNGHFPHRLGEVSEEDQGKD